MSLSMLQSKFWQCKHRLDSHWAHLHWQKMQLLFSPGLKPRFLAYEPGSLAYEPGSLAYEPGSLAYEPGSLAYRTSTLT